MMAAGVSRIPLQAAEPGGDPTECASRTTSALFLCKEGAVVQRNELVRSGGYHLANLSSQSGHSKARNSEGRLQKTAAAQHTAALSRNPT